MDKRKFKELPIGPTYKWEHIILFILLAILCFAGLLWLILLFPAVRKMSSDTIAGEYFVAVVWAVLLFKKPEYWIMFKRNLIKVNLGKALLVPLVTGPLLHYSISISQNMPKVFGYPTIPVGAGQMTTDLGVLTVPEFVFKALFPAFNEEFLFRFLPYTFLFIFLTTSLSLASQSRRIKIINWGERIQALFGSLGKRVIRRFIVAFYEQRVVYLQWMWITGISILFALMHEPSLINFHFYFLPGALFTWLFLRYGFASAFLAHMSFNFIGEITYGQAINTIQYFFGI